MEWYQAMLLVCRGERAKSDIAFYRAAWNTQGPAGARPARRVWRRPERMARPAYGNPAPCRAYREKNCLNARQVSRRGGSITSRLAIGSSLLRMR